MNYTCIQLLNEFEYQFNYFIDCSEGLFEIIFMFVDGEES